jgi:hypothetical protein
MTDDEDLSVREAVEWCGNCVTLREITRLRRRDGGQQDGARESRIGLSAAGVAAPAETLPMIRMLCSGWGDRSCGERSSRGVETTWKEDWP